MRKRISRGRGRPRGKYYSPTDFRLLQYLALVSMKYGINSHDFFDGFAEAWKDRKSIRGNLSIECRKQTQDNAAFLITSNGEVVAQFSVPKHILEEINPLKEFVHRLSVFSSER